MGQFEERQKLKNRLDDEMLAESVQQLGSVVSDAKTRGGNNSERLYLIHVVEDLGRYLDLRIPYSSNPDVTIDWYHEEFFRPQGIAWRTVKLKAGWYEDACGVMLGTFSDGRPVVFHPSGWSGYSYIDPDTGRKIRITQKNAGLFQSEATLYYRPLPMRKITQKDIWAYIRKSVSLWDFLALIAATIVSMLLGMITPAMTSLLLSEVVESKDLRLLAVIFAVLFIITIAVFIITSMKQLLLARISTKVAVPLQTAFMMRVLSAPAGELRSFSAGDLGMKVGSMYSNLKQLLNMFLSMMLTAACSFFCFIQMFQFAAGPALIALAVTIILVILYIHVILKQADVSTDRMVFQAEESGLTYSLIDGMQKITLAGAEKRAFSIWAGVYQKSVRTLYDPPLLLKVFSMLTPVIMLAGMILMYLTAFSAEVPPSSFIAFLSSYGLLTGALTMVSTNVTAFANALPVFRVLKPVMDLEPETGGDKEVVQRLKGNISVRDVTFRYTPAMPPVLENLNMEIHAGDYVAIVGSTGCGKTTIMRLLLGLENPDHGSILYDGKNLQSLDVTSLRRKIGSVLQNGEIFQGTIFSNITISGTATTQRDGPFVQSESASGAALSEADAWEAAEIAGIADDIRHMPLQMNTPLPDGGRGVSGGQKQRLLIARAIASKPSILIFDEATSALDNLTQKAVSDAIGELSCTRIVIAHRLSTIQNCDRIFCLDKGHIVEEGSYEELMEKDGFFAELVRRQQI